MVTSRVRHVGFVVRDLERSLGFYCGILGLTLYKREIEEGAYIENLVGIKGVRLEWAKLNVPEGGLIELLSYVSHPDPEVLKKSESIPSNRLGSGHVAFTVANLDKLYKALIKDGILCNSEPLIAPSGKAKILYCHDPDGIILELIEDLK